MLTAFLAHVRSLVFARSFRCCCRLPSRSGSDDRRLVGRCHVAARTGHRRFHARTRTVREILKNDSILCSPHRSLYTIQRSSLLCPVRLFRATDCLLLLSPVVLLMRHGEGHCPSIQHCSSRSFPPSLHTAHIYVERRLLFSDRSDFGRTQASTQPTTSHLRWVFLSSDVRLQRMRKASNCRVRHVPLTSGPLVDGDPRVQRAVRVGY